MNRVVSLNGAWNFEAEGTGANSISIPSCWENVMERKDFSGPCSVWREFNMDNIPDGKRIAISFGGVSYYCDVFINDSHVGSHEGMWDSFWFDVTDFLKKGKNLVRLDIWKPGYKNDDRFPVRQVLSGFIPDVACTFGGIWDDVKLIETDGIFIDSHWADGSFEKGSIKLVAELYNLRNTEVDVTVTWDITDMEGNRSAMLFSSLKIAAHGSSKVDVQTKIADVIPWDIHNPYLYSYKLSITGEGIDQHTSRKFGIRDIKAKGTQITLNGKPIYPRGILHWGYYDDAIFPNPSKEAINEEIAKIKSYGFNMIKHCLYLPREEYFEAADEQGILLWVELPLWLPEFTPELPKRIEREYPRMLRQIIGYSSVVLLSLGCELDSSVDASILERMYKLARSMSSSLVRDNSGSGECYDGLPTDFADFFDYHFYADLHNIENLMESFTPGWRNRRPWLYGEFCDSDTMRSLQHVRSMKNVEALWWEQNDKKLNPICELKPDFRCDKHDERMQKYEINQDFDLIHQLSVNHSMVHRKMTIELTRSFPAICGYNITSLRDVPIATSGLFDDLMNPKFNDADFRIFNSDIVLAPAWDLTRIWINGDRVQNRERFNFFSGQYYGLHIIISNYSRSEIKTPVVRWELKCGNEVAASFKGCIDKKFECGEVAELIYIGIKLPQVECPKTYLLTVEMEDGQKHAKNLWPVFVYPTPSVSDDSINVYDANEVFWGLNKKYKVNKLADGQQIKPCSFVATSRMTPEICRFVEQGGKVLLVQRGEGFLPAKRVAFWREGMIRRYKHDLLEGLEYNWLDDLRFFSLSTDTAFDSFGFKNSGIKDVRPIIRRYDCREWEAADYMLEFSMGSGTVLATTLRFEGGMGKQPLHIDNNPFALYLLDKIYRYLTGK